MCTDICKLLVKAAPEIEADGPIGPALMFKTIVPLGKEIGASIAHAPTQSRWSSGCRRRKGRCPRASLRRLGRGGQGRAAEYRGRGTSLGGGRTVGSARSYRQRF